MEKYKRSHTKTTNLKNQLTRGIKILKVYHQKLRNSD